jgi:hypothetical protein
VEVDRERVRLLDRGSTNGTFVGATRIRDADLLGGADVRVGTTTFRVELDESPTFVQLSMRESFGLVIGSSVEMRRLYAILERVAPTDSTVLLQGETGTGKDLVACSIHEASPRAAGPFTAVDCGSIAEGLFESELFGHVRGAFTGADKDRRGLFQIAPNSGPVQTGTPMAGGRGRMIGGALEASNVDLAKEFTDMIVAQRGFQANARTISTADELLQELVNLRR